jgi:hypothetical protein
MASDPDQKRGLYRKYFVQRLDERDATPDVLLRLMRLDTRERPMRERTALPPPKHDRCRYYVLDLDHDKFAGPALRAYAAACAAEFPALAADLRRLAPPSAEGEAHAAAKGATPVSTYDGRTWLSTGSGRAPASGEAHADPGRCSVCGGPGGYTEVDGFSIPRCCAPRAASGEAHAPEATRAAPPSPKCPTPTKGPTP